jgi:DNA-binding MarR family transcriptional regulator
LVERRNDTHDRRVINIVITETGVEFLQESLETLKEIIKENLSELSSEDIESLDSAFQTIKGVVSKLEERP